MGNAQTGTVQCPRADQAILAALNAVDTCADMIDPKTETTFEEELSSHRRYITTYANARRHDRPLRANQRGANSAGLVQKNTLQSLLKKDPTKSKVKKINENFLPNKNEEEKKSQRNIPQTPQSRKSKQLA